GPPYPRSSRTRGRMHVVLAGEATEVQAVFMTTAEARAWATSGTVTVPVSFGTTETSTVDRDALESVTREPTYTLAGAARESWCPLDAAAIRQRKRRAGDAWPAPAEVHGLRDRWTETQLRAALGLDDPAPAAAA